MKKSKAIKHYSQLEENINIASHAIGLIFSVIASVLLFMHANQNGNIRNTLSVAIFGISLIILYAASTFYHSAKKPALRSRLRVIDHAAIYLLIAGTYTPFTLVTLNGTIGWTIFSASWSMALVGITLKIFFTGKYKLFSTLMYIFMGWIIIFAIKPLVNNLASAGLFWLITGGMAYTTGAILYSIKKIKFNHAIFHIFVLVGSGCHFVSVFFYVLPTP
jgi:hemolysin III